MGTSRENQYKFLIISYSFFLRMRNVSDSSCRENQNTHFVLNNFFSKIVPLWGSVEKYCRARQATDDNVICRMCIAFWIPKSKNTHSEYVILIAFPLQQWLHERTSVLRYMYTARLVKRLWQWHITFIIGFLEFVRDLMFWRQRGNLISFILGLKLIQKSRCLPTLLLMGAGEMCSEHKAMVEAQKLINTNKC
jgi:hypothetical protein